MSDNIDIVISDKVDNSISTKLDSIAASADTADNALTRLKASLALINTSPIKTLQDAANAATTAIDKNALANQRLATEAAKTATAQQNTATATANTAKAQELAAVAAQKLTTETQRTATATAQAAAAQDRAAIAALRLEEAQNNVGKATHEHGLSFGKLVAGMVAGMVVMEALQAVISGVRFATLGSIEAIDDFQQSAIQMSAILTSLAKDQTDIPGTYQQARAYAEQLNVTLQKVDANTSLNLNNLQSISQEMAKQGVTLDTTNKAQVENYTKIANAVAVYSRNGKDERQVRQEVAALMKGEVRQGDELAKLLDRITNGHLKELVTEWKRVGVETGNQGYAIDKIGQALSGFDPASKELQGTWSAVTSSIQTAATMLQRAFFRDMFGDVISSGNKFSEWLKSNEGTVAGWGRNFLKVIYDISAEVIRMGMLLDKAGGTATSAQMLLYGPGKALGVKSSTERFDRAAQNNIDFENRYNEKSKMLEDLAIKMNKLDELATKAGKKVIAPKLSSPIEDDKKAIAEADKQWRAYSSAFDQLSQKIIENNPNLTKLQQSLSAVDAEVNRAILAAPMYAESLRKQGEAAKDSIRQTEGRRIALANLRAETKATEDAVKDMTTTFAWYDKKTGVKKTAQDGLLPTNMLTFKPQPNKYSLNGPAESGFSQLIPTDTELQRLNKSTVEIEKAKSALNLELNRATGIDVFIDSLGRVTDGYSNVLQGLSNSFGDFFQGLSNGFANSIGNAIVYGDNLKDSLRGVAQEITSSLIGSLVKLGIQYVVNAALGESIAATALATQTGLSVAAATATATAWAPAAALVSLASFGANSVPAIAGITTTSTLTEGIALTSLAGFESGGYTGNVGTKDVAGVVHGQEFVMNAAATARNRDLLEAMNRGGTPVTSGASPKSSRPGINLSINNYGTSKEFEVQQLSETEIRVIARDEGKRAAYEHAPRAVAAEIRNPNSVVSKSLDRNTQTQRKR